MSPRRMVPVAGLAAVVGALCALAALALPACGSNDGVTPVCDDAGSCFTEIGDAPFGSDAQADDGAATSDQ